MTYPAYDPALPVVAVDFDGVLAENVWPAPGAGDADPDALDLVEHYFNEGCEIVVFTARPEQHFQTIWDFLEEHDIAHMVYEITGKKPRACLYFDDRAVRWPLCG